MDLRPGPCCLSEAYIGLAHLSMRRIYIGPRDLFGPGATGTLGDQGPYLAQGPIWPRDPRDPGALGDLGPRWPKGPLGDLGPRWPKGPLGDLGPRWPKGPWGTWAPVA